VTSSSRYQQAAEIFDRVCDLPAGERDAFVERACAP